MTDTDYSQSGEQAHLLELAKDLRPGRFLDIGAGDGQTFSNTRALAEAGWGGLLVEPAPWAFERLVDLYGDDPNYDLVAAVITPEEVALTRFSYAKDDHVSTVDPEHARTWKHHVDYRTFWVPGVSLGALLDKGLGINPSIVSIDAEGLSTQLVKRYMQHPAWADVRVVVYEPEPGERFKLQRWQGWEPVAETTNNHIYAR